LINQLRASQGLARLTVDPQLAEQARIQAAQSAATATPQATPSLNVVNDRVGGRYAVVSENPLEGPSIAEAHQLALTNHSLMENYLRPTDNSIGVGVVYRQDQRVFYVTEYFGQLGTGGRSG
jgi:uncharacterized protein YkwD